MSKQDTSFGENMAGTEISKAQRQRGESLKENKASASPVSLPAIAVFLAGAS